VKLTVILPVSDESATIRTVVRGVLGLDCPGVQIELIIAENNSTDGTAEIVDEYRDHPRVTVVHRKGPPGKGLSVRNALSHAAGDVILIQDGDLEYCIDDYPLLLAPLMTGEASFVLGSRYVRGRPMRSFPNARLMAGVMNCAHRVFTGLFNVVYGTRLSDPFTMYKVFRRDSLNGVSLACKRFDFDLELVAKLVRLGHIPLEVPVAYRSRTRREGKKVRVLADPPTWIVALIRCRFARLGPSGVRPGRGRRRCSGELTPAREPSSAWCLRPWPSRRRQRGHPPWPGDPMRMGRGGTGRQHGSARAPGSLPERQGRWLRSQRASR